LNQEFQQIGWDAEIEADLRKLVRLAIHEDLDGRQDWTTTALVEADQRGEAAVVVRAAGIVAGLRAMPVLLDEMEADIEWNLLIEDGDDVTPDEPIAQLQGSAHDLLICERPLLNLLGHLSGIATLTGRYVEQVAETDAKIYDTRKTTLGWRRLEKYAVGCGGGQNHRTGLFDAVLIKDNHLALAANSGMTLTEAVEQAHEFLAKQDVAHMIVEIEVDSLEQLQQVLSAKPDIVLLDNMPPAMLRQAVEMRDRTERKVALEASGGISLQTVRAIAETGVERISVGALTHSASTLDLGLDWGA